MIDVCALQKEKHDRLSKEMQAYNEELKQLNMAVKNADRAHRNTANAARQAMDALNNKKAELEAAHIAEDEMKEQHMQATQVGTVPSVTFLGCWD